MKKITFYLVAFVLLSFTANSQITITLADMPTIGITITEATDTVCSNVSIGNSGANQVWNFTNIANHDQETSSWVNPTTLPGSSNFPTAQIAITKPGSQDSYVRGSSTSFEMLGIHGDISGMGTTYGNFNPPYKYFQFPTNYQTSFSGNYSFYFSIPYPNPPIDSLKLTFNATYSTVVDAWGTASTPIYSNVPCLRQKMYSVTAINSFIHNTLTGTWLPTGNPAEYDTSLNYIWLSNLQKFTLASIETTPTGTVINATYLLSTGSIGVNENSNVKTNIDIFPNPANEYITVSGITKNAIILVFDSNGKLLTNRILKTFKNTLNVSDYNNGMYFYQVVDLDGRLLNKGKFSVIR